MRTLLPRRSACAMTELRDHEQLAETAYHAMYDATASYMVKAHFEDACLHLVRSIAAARELGSLDDAARLELRLDHVRKVYDHQFRGA